MQVDGPHVERDAQRGVEQYHPGHRDRGLDRVLHVKRCRQRQDQRRAERDGVLDCGGGPEVDITTEPLLVHPTGGQPGQCDQQQQHHRIKAAFGDQPAGTRGEHGDHTEPQCDDPHPGEPITEEYRRQHAGGHRVHRDDDGAQHRRCPVLDRVVQRAELDRLHQQAGNRDMTEFGPAGPRCAGRDRPRAQYRSRQPEPECQYRHGRHRMHGQIADRVSQCVEKCHRTGGGNGHAGVHHDPMLTARAVLRPTNIGDRIRSRFAISPTLRSTVDACPRC